MRKKYLKRKINKRLRAGETLVETLVSLLISCLALALLAVSVAASSKINTQTKEKSAEYYTNSNNIAAYQSGSTKYSGTVSFSRAISPDGNKPVNVELFMNDSLSGTEVVSYTEVN